MKELLDQTDFKKWFSDYSESKHHLNGWRDYDQYLDEVELPEILFCALIQKWLREVHNMHINISFDTVELGNRFFVMIGYEKDNSFEYKIITYPENVKDILLRKVFTSYELALEEGIKQALKLIKQ